VDPDGDATRDARDIAFIIVCIAISAKSKPSTKTLPPIRALPKVG
jgi:hypothetical protein